jgi:hypothetical protein
MLFYLMEIFSSDMDQIETGHQAVNNLSEFLSARFEIACELGFPAFPDGVVESTPLNSAPYVISMAQLEMLAADDVRREMVGKIGSMIRELSESGVEARILLIGGSFLEQAKQPKDMDCALFYVAGADGFDMNLERYRHECHRSGLDVRFLPLDIDPILVLKTAIFFGLLYSRSKKHESTDARGCLLVRC